VGCLQHRSHHRSQPCQTFGSVAHLTSRTTAYHVLRVTTEHRPRQLDQYQGRQGRVVPVTLHIKFCSERGTYEEVYCCMLEPRPNNNRTESVRRERLPAPLPPTWGMIVINVNQATAEDERDRQWPAFPKDLVLELFSLPPRKRISGDDRCVQRIARTPRRSVEAGPRRATIGPKAVHRTGLSVGFLEKIGSPERPRPMRSAKSDTPLLHQYVQQLRNTHATKKAVVSVERFPQCAAVARHKYIGVTRVNSDRSSE